MNVMERILIFAHLFLVTASTQLHTNQVIMISFDGFRHDYLDMMKAKGYETPNFDFLIENGVKADYLKNVFITKTFPNHYTLVTGMYEESHGVISNNMFDSKYNETFTLKLSDQVSSGLNKWFTNDTVRPDEGPEPIWVTNQKGAQHDIPRSTGVVMWPGCTAKVHNLLPSHFLPYNKSMANEARVDQIIEWMTADMPINLALLYFSEPDHIGHAFGPYSDEVKQVILTLDGVVGYLIKKLKEHNLFERTNIIITSDHGMQLISNTTYVDDYVSPDLYDAYGGSPVVSVMPQAGVTVDELVSKFSKVPHITVWRKEDIPRKFFYTYNRRILPILIVADDYWHICGSRKGCYASVGNHGFSNDNNDMHPFFFAHGPAFKTKARVPHFNNVDVYRLLCKLLDLDPAPNNGSNRAIDLLLQGNDKLLTQTAITFLSVVVFASLVAGIFCIAALRAKPSSHTLRSSPTYSGSAENRSNAKEGQQKLLSSDSEDAFEV